jgi:type VI secretion system protein ImpF
VSGRAGPRGGPRAQLPLLDRLIDDEPEHKQDAPMSPAEALLAFRASIRRDLEMLLNGRRRFRTWPARFRQLDTSPLAFGIPDCTAGTFSDRRERETLRAEIEDTIRRFDPRFAQLSVSLVDPEQRGFGSTLRLRIDGIVRAEPQPEPVSFDTTVDAVTTDVVVRTLEYG